ncbi:hypothetical protein K402DRAFT_396528 [Aulographum hederae CBS 113979]|uniref:Uncharacterized protein n=1 Tax=Aulographum hederae CBS 113979 TaxID=1176131 RepID=A0A6G1GRU0_9PEZI|nr:hypothetical protein K402DRAFT_396528 [Aulographum hederae CBS 113979]
MRKSNPLCSKEALHPPTSSLSPYTSQIRILLPAFLRAEAAVEEIGGILRRFEREALELLGRYLEVLGEGSEGSGRETVDGEMEMEMDVEIEMEIDEKDDGASEKKRRRISIRTPLSSPSSSSSSSSTITSSSFSSTSTSTSPTAQIEASLLLLAHNLVHDITATTEPLLDLEDALQTSFLRDSYPVRQFEILTGDLWDGVGEVVGVGLVEEGEMGGEDGDGDEGMEMKGDGDGDSDDETDELMSWIEEVHRVVREFGYGVRVYGVGLARLREMVERIEKGAEW